MFLRAVYFIDAPLSKDDIVKISSALLIDKVLEDFKVSPGIFSKKPLENEIIIAYNPGVFDSFVCFVGYLFNH